MTGIFAPAVKLANRLTYPQKLILLGSFISIFFILLLVLIFQQLNQTVSDSKIQLEGVDRIVELNIIVKLVQQHRGLSQSIRSGATSLVTKRNQRQIEVTEAIDKLISSIDSNMPLVVKAGALGGKADLTNLREFWLKITKAHLKTASDEEFLLHTELIEQLQLLMKLMSGHYLLLTDRDTSFYYMNNILSRIAPSITESMGNLRAIMLERIQNESTNQNASFNIERLKFSLNSNFYDFEFDLVKIIHSSPYLESQMVSIHNKLVTARDEHLKLLDTIDKKTKIVNAEDDLWNRATSNIDLVFETINENMASSLREHINRRIELASSIIKFSSLVSLIAIIIILYFSVAWYKAMVNKVKEIRERVKEYSNDDFGSTISLDTHDEMRDISIAINEMVVKLDRSRERLLFQQMALNYHAIVSIADVKGNITYVNPRFEEISQYSKEELIGVNHRIVKSGHHSIGFFNNMWKQISSGKIWTGEIKNRAKDDSFYWVESTIVPRLNSQGKPVQYISIRTDITNIKLMEMELMKINKALLSEQLTTKEEAKRLDKIIDIAMDASIQMDEQGIIVGWNRKAEVIFGWNKSEAIGTLLHTLIIPEEYRERHIEGLNRCLKAGNSDLFNSPIEITALNSHGDEFPIEISVSQVEYRGSYQFSAFIRDLSQQKSYEKSILKAKEDATQANKAKSDFLSSMSHELRTPLNAILGFAELVEVGGNASLSDKQSNSMEQIIGSGEHLLNLVNEVLELSEIESGNIKLSIETLEIQAEIEEALSLIKNVAENANIEIKILSDQIIKLLADKTKLKQVLINLVTNAIKYNRKNGSVTLHWQKMINNSLRVSIIDTGIGISGENKDKIFVAFDRLGIEKSKIEGTGIGLVVTKQLVESMGGNIGFETVENQGTTFWFELPLAES